MIAKKKQVSICSGNQLCFHDSGGRLNRGDLFIETYIKNIKNYEVKLTCKKTAGKQVPLCGSSFLSHIVMASCDLTD